MRTPIFPVVLAAAVAGCAGGRNLAAESAEDRVLVYHPPISTQDGGTASARPPEKPPAGGGPAQQAEPPVSEAKAEIGRLLDDWHAAAADADEERYFARFASGGVFFGTDARERWDVSAFRAYAHPYFARGRAWSFAPGRREIHLGAGGNTAWFAEDLQTPNLGPARGTGVLVREGGAWKIAQYALSLTVPNEKLGEVRKLLESASR